MSMPQRKFDSLSYVKELKNAGFTEQQAMVQAEMLSAVAEDQSLTKQDLKQTESGLTLKIEEVRREIKEVEAKLSLEIGQVRREIREVEAKLSLEIEQIRREIRELETKLSLEIEQVRREIKELEVKISYMETRIVFRLTKTMVILFGLSMGLIGIMIKLIH